MAIILTEAAAREIQRIKESQNLGEEVHVRMGIGGGGCAGLQYSLQFDTEYDPKVDARYEQHGISIVVRKKFDLHLDGTRIDFVNGPGGSGFAIENPNYPRGGGCPGCGGGV